MIVTSRHPSGRWLAAAVSAALVLLTAAVGMARPARPALHWVRGEQAKDCVDPRTLAHLVEGITGPTLVAAGEAERSIEARIERSAEAQYTVHLAVSQASATSQGERVATFAARDCRTLDGTIAFLIAMAIDPELGAEGIPAELSWIDEQERAPTELLESPSAPPPPVPSQPTAAAPPAPRAETTAKGRRPGWTIAAALGVGQGVSARPAASFVLSGARGLSRHLGLALQLSAATALGAREVSGVGLVSAVTTQRFGLALSGCADWPVLRALDVRGCVGPEVAAILAHGRGFSENRDALTYSFGLALRLEASLLIAPHWRVLAAGLLLWAAKSPSIQYEYGATTVDLFRAPPLLLQGLLGVSYEF